MNEKKRNRFDLRLLVGLLIVVAGVLMLLERMDLGLDISFRTYWPMLLIILGIGNVASPGHSRRIFSGLVMVIVGTLFQLRNLGVFYFHFKDLWPLVIILVGFAIIRKSFWAPRSHCGFYKLGGTANNGAIHGLFSGSEGKISTDTVEVSTTFGGGEYKVTSKQFKGGNVDAVFGAIELDLREAEMAGDSVVLNVSATFGSVEIRIPSHWQVVLEGVPSLGNMDNKTTAPQETTKKLIIKGSASFGSIEVRN